MATLKIITEDNEKLHEGVSGTGPFSFNFAYFDDDDLNVDVDGVTIPSNKWSDTPVVVDGGYDGGTVTLVDSVTVADVRIWRSTKLLRETQLGSGGATPGSIDTEFNRIVTMAQDISKAVDSVKADANIKAVGEDLLGDDTIGDVALALGDGTLAAFVTDAQQGAEDAIDARDAAIVAAEGSGVSAWYDTKSAMTAALASHTEGSVVGVFADEDLGGLSAHYRKEAGSWVFKIALDRSVTWYVDSILGNDGNRGLQTTSAFKSLGRALTSLRSGDRLRLRRGSIWRETLELINHTRIDCRSYGSGPYPIISGKDLVSSFTHHSGACYTFTQSISTSVVAARGYAGVFEDGNWLKQVEVGDAGIANEAAAIGYVVATPGTFYFAGPGTTLAGWGAGVKTYYIHASDGGNPASNGKVYEAFSRQRSINAGSNNKLSHVVSDGGYHHDGIASGDFTEFEHILQIRAARHSWLTQQCIHRDCTSMKMNPKYGGTGFHSAPGVLVYGGSESRWERCRVFGNGEGATANTAFFGHGVIVDTAAVDRRVYVDCEAYNVDTVISGGEANYIDAIRMKARNFKIAFYCSALLGASLIDCDFRGGNYRVIYIRRTNGSPVVIRGGYYEVYGDDFIYSLDGIKTIDIQDCTIVQHGSFVSGGNTRFISGGPGAVDLVRIKNVRYIGSYSTENSLLFFSVEPTAWDVDGFLVALANGPSPKVRIAGAYSPLIGRAGVSNVRSVEPSQISASSDATSKIAFRQGSWCPGDPVYNAVVYSQNGAQQPRSTIIVGSALYAIHNTARVGAIMSTTLPAGEMRAICFGNSGYYVAVGDDGEVMSTGYLAVQTWASRSSGTSENLNAVAGDSTGKFVAVGENGTIIKSSNNGVSWTAATTVGTSEDLYGVATDGTTWIAVGTAGVVGVSTDAGDTWTFATVGSATWRCAFRHPTLSLFIIGGDDGNLRTSPTGSISWTSRTMPHRCDVVDMDFSSSRIVAVLIPKNGHVATMMESANGTDWVTQTDILPFTPRGISGPGTSTYLDNAFCIVGDSAYSSQSYDGRTWSCYLIDSPSQDRLRECRPNDAVLAEYL